MPACAPTHLPIHTHTHTNTHTVYDWWLFHDSRVAVAKFCLCKLCVCTCKQICRSVNVCFAVTNCHCSCKDRRWFGGDEVGYAVTKLPLFSCSSKFAAAKATCSIKALILLFCICKLILKKEGHFCLGTVNFITAKQPPVFVALQKWTFAATNLCLKCGSDCQC